MNDFEELQETKDSAEGAVDPFVELDNNSDDTDEIDEFGEVEVDKEEDEDEILTEIFEDVDSF